MDTERIRGTKAELRRRVIASSLVDPIAARIHELSPGPQRHGETGCIDRHFGSKAQGIARPYDGMVTRTNEIGQFTAPVGDGVVPLPVDYQGKEGLIGWVEDE